MKWRHFVKFRKSSHHFALRFSIITHFQIALPNQISYIRLLGAHSGSPAEQHHVVFSIARIDKIPCVTKFLQHFYGHPWFVYFLSSKCANRPHSLWSLLYSKSIFSICSMFTESSSNISRSWPISRCIFTESQNRKERNRKLYLQDQ